MRRRIVRALATSSLALCAIATSRTEAARPEIDAKGIADERRLAEVVVTARRREENLQSVPAAVSVASGDLLDGSYTLNTRQLSLLVPALYYNSTNPRNTAYTIRGLGSNTLSISAANDCIEPGVGFYVDQVYHGRPATSSFDFTDIDRGEVLRGPQGTLVQVIEQVPGPPVAEAEVPRRLGQRTTEIVFDVQGAVSAPMPGSIHPQRGLARYQAQPRRPGADPSGRASPLSPVSTP